MSSESFNIFCTLAFGTTFDPKNKQRRKKKNKRKHGEIDSNEKEVLSKKDISAVESAFSDECNSDLSDEEITSVAAPMERKQKQKKRLSAMQLFKIRKEEVTHFRRTHKICVNGDDVPDPVETFHQLVTDYETNPVLLENIQQLCYETPTPIQMQAIPLMMHERQILACAPTGSGKTAAFLIPLIHQLKEPKENGIRAVVLAPTRELAKQIKTVCEKLSKGIGVRSLLVENANEVKGEVFKKFDILISTPNRLIYMLKRDSPVLSLKKVEWLVVDECDKLFEAGKEECCFRTQLATIYNACESAKRALFSATFSHDVEQWCQLNLDSLVCISIGNKNTAVETIKQELLFVGSESGKLLALRNLFQGGFCPPVLVFVQSKERAKELFSEIALSVRRVDVIHSDLPQEKRDRVVENFIEGKVWVLVCTELMGRGIDFKGVRLVINYDFPLTAISYIHRIGRTGRAGAEGKAVTYFTSDDVENLKSIAQVMKNAGCEVPAYIMSLKTKKKNKGEVVRPIKRQKISTVPKYELQKRSKKRGMIQASIRKKKKPKKKASE